MSRMALYLAVAILFLVAVAFFMRSPQPYTRFTFDAGSDDAAAAIHLPIEPHGVAQFVSPDMSADSTKLIDEVVSVWPELWPKMIAYLDSEMKDYGVEAVLGKDEFIASLVRMTPDVYMGDQSDIMIRLEFEEPPLWDFFIRGSSIVHSQPVF
jgi:hypothetical protein